MRKRRGNNEGSIYQRADGRWCATITVGYDAQGKRRRRTVFGKTKRDVQEKLTRLASQKLDGTLGEPSRVTVGQYLDRWLEDSARPAIQETTYDGYKTMIRLHITPRIGGVPLSKLTPVHIQSMYSAMERDGRSAHTRKRCHAVLHRALGRAVKWGLVPRNVCGPVEPPRPPKATMHTLTPDQARLFLEVAGGAISGDEDDDKVEPDRLYAMYVLAISTGLRQGELLGLQWSDVDLERGSISVRHSLAEIRGRLLLKEPKSAKGRRQVSLPQVAVDALAEHRKQMLAEGHAASPWVFCDTQGGPIRKSNLRRRSFDLIMTRTNQRIVNDAKKRGVKTELLPPIRFHDLRHTSATLMLAQGVHPKIVQERLGHATIAVTLDTYSHVLPSMQQEAAAKMDSLLREKTA